MGLLLLTQALQATSYSQGCASRPQFFITTAVAINHH